MRELEPQITMNADVTNPGQFFACCGLLELAHRLWPGTEAWFGSVTGQTSFSMFHPEYLFTASTPAAESRAQSGRLDAAAREATAMH
jgi:CRISPR-associated protein Csb3